MGDVPRMEVPQHFQTERLDLLRPTHEHVEPLIQLATDERVARTLGGVQNREAAWRNAASVIGHWTIRGYGLYAVMLRQTGQCIGRIGYLQPEGWPGLELGWTLAAEHWGKGYATEAGQFLMRYALIDLALPQMISLIEPENTRSIAVAERLGMQRGDPLRLMDKFDVEVWSRTAN